jgi:hypothetical protein
MWALKSPVRVVHLERRPVAGWVPRFSRTTTLRDTAPLGTPPKSTERGVAHRTGAARDGMTGIARGAVPSVDDVTCTAAGAASADR